VRGISKTSSDKIQHPNAFSSFEVKVLFFISTEIDGDGGLKRKNTIRRVKR